MKSILNSLIALLVITLSVNATEISKSEASLATGANTKGSCSNYNTRSECSITWFIGNCKECEKKCQVKKYTSSYSSANECDNEESTTSGDTYSEGSIIDNRSFNYIHYAADWVDATVNNDPMCSSCGDKTPGISSTSIPQLGFMRFHRFRNVTEYSSLGGGVFSNWDLNLTLFKDANNNNRVDISDPNDLNTRRLFPQSGKFYDTYGRSYDGLTLYKEDGTTTTNIDLADTGTLKTKTGRFFHFEIFSIDEFTKMGRLKKILDRNDYGIEITYEISDYRADEITVPDPLSKFRMASISDPTNRSLTFTYLTDGSGAFVKRRGCYPIHTMTVPNGTAITYNYGPTQDDGLISVDYPDGTQTTITTDEDSGRTRVHFFEASEDHNNKRKSVYLTNNFVSNPTKDGLDYYNSAALLIDFATRGHKNTTENPDSEKVTYAGMVDGHIMHRKVYEAGGVLKWIDIDVARYYSNWSLSGDPATGSAAFTGTRESTYNHGEFKHYAGNRQGRPPVKFDKKGVKYTMVYNGNGSITRRNYTDGTFEAWSYNLFEQPTRYRDRLGRVSLNHYDDRGNHLMSIVGLKAEPVAAGSERVAGMFFKLYDGTFSLMPDFSGLIPVDYGITPSYEIDGTDRDENYAMTFEGDLEITTPGDYVFTTGSDDGSKLYIDDVLVVDNDGLHSLTEVDSVPVTLTAGYHKIRVEFFEKSGQQKLFVYYNGPDSGSVKTLIPQTALSHMATGLTEEDTIQEETAVIVKEYYPVGHTNQFLLKYNFDAVLFPTGQNLSDYTSLINHITSTNNKRTEYQYNADNQLVEIIEPDDEGTGYHTAWSFRYDSAKRLWKSIDAGSVFEDLPITDIKRRTTENTYDFRDRLIQKTYSDGSTELFTYGNGENANQLEYFTDRNGNVTKNSYDELNRLEFVTVGFGSSDPSVTEYKYLTGSDNILSIESDGDLTEYGYDYRLRRVERKVYADDNSTLVTTQVYKDNKLFCEIDPYGRKTYHLYRNSDSVEVRTIVGNYPAYTLNDYTAVETEVRDLGNNATHVITDYTVDVENQITELIDGRGIRHTNSYNNRGWHVKAVEAADSIAKTTEYKFDAMNNLIETRHPRFFDSTDLDGYQQAATRNVFSRRNKLLSTTEAYYSTLAATARKTYYNDGNEASVSDFKENITEKVWKICCGRLGVVAGPSFTDKEGNLKRSVEIAEYDHFGNSTHTATLTWNANDPLPPCCYPDPLNSITLSETTTRYDSRLRPIAKTKWLEPLDYVNPNSVQIGTDEGESKKNVTTRVIYYDELTDHPELDPLLLKLSEDGITFSGNTGSARAEINGAGEVIVNIYDGAGRMVAAGMVDKTTWSVGTAGTLVSWGTTIYDNLDSDTGLLITESRSALDFSEKQFVDASGRLIKTLDAKGKISTFSYDANNNLLVSEDGNSNKITCAFDDLNRKVTCTDDEGSVRSVVYNLSNQSIQAVDAKSKSDNVKFDARNRPYSITNRENKTKSIQYDANNEVVAEWDENQEAYAFSDYSKATRYLYDDRSVLITMAMPGHPVGSADDNYINLSTSISNADYDLVKCVSDALERTVLCTDQNGDSVDTTYDMLSRMSQTKYYAGLNLESTDEYTYDGASRPLTAFKGRYNNSIICEYDNIGRKFKETIKLGRPESEVSAQSFSTECSFDADNRKDTCEYPSGNLLDVSFDSRSQLETIDFNDTTVASFSYDDGMREKTRTFGNGLVSTFDYYKDNTKKSVTVKDSVLNTRDDLTFSYTLDSNKNVLTETSNGSILGGFSWTSTFDDLDRVETYDRNNGDSQNFDMDPLGNWQSTSGSYNGTTFSESRSGEYDDVNQLLGFTRSGSPRTALDYDKKGNLILDEFGATLVWDIDNKLQAYTNGGLTVNFEYDAAGRRLVKEVVGISKTYFISEGQTVLEEYSENAGSFTLERSYVHGTYVDDIVAKIEAGTTPIIQYYHSDRQFNVRALTDNSENILELYAYSPFGKQTIMDSSGSILSGSAYENKYGFTGRYLDSEIGLWHFRARYFSDTLGRFISRDPMGFVDGMNLYNAYFAETFNLDPFGYCNFEADATEVFQTMAEEFLEKFAIKLAKKFAKGKLKKAVGMFVPGLNIVLTAWTIYDAAQGARALYNYKQSITRAVKNLELWFNWVKRKFGKCLEKKKCCDIVKKYLRLIIKKGFTKSKSIRSWPKLTKDFKNELTICCKKKCNGNTNSEEIPAELYHLEKRNKKKDTYKIGETMHGEDAYGPGKQKRYTKKELEAMDGGRGVDYVKKESGNKKGIKTEERRQLNEYFKKHGKYPDGNKTNH